MGFVVADDRGQSAKSTADPCLWPRDSPHVWPSESPHLIGLIHQLGPLGGDGGGANQHTDHPGDTAIEVSEGTYGHCRRV
jgi:hypothetical protein